MAEARDGQLSLSVAGVQFLGLALCLHFINNRNASLIATAAEHILQASAPAHAAYDDIEAAVTAAHERAEDVLCTWRPRYCLDLFIYTSAESAESFIGIVMHGRSPSVEFFRNSDCISVPAATPGVVFGHLTCDTSDTKKWGDTEIAERGRSVLVMRARYRSAGLIPHQRGWTDAG